MILRRALSLGLAAVLFGAGGAAAQFPQQEPPCLKDFAPLRDDAAKKANAIKVASERKVAPVEACQLFKIFAAAEAKVVKYAGENAVWCGIPAEAVAQMKTNHSRTLALRAQVCKAAANPARAAGPSLSEALGAPGTAGPDTIKPGHGTFDTLTGTPFGSK